MKVPFRVCLSGYFYSLELYDQNGREVFSLEDACEAAEQVFESEWESVYNGGAELSREDYLASLVAT